MVGIVHLGMVGGVPWWMYTPPYYVLLPHPGYTMLTPRTSVLHILPLSVVGRTVTRLWAQDWNIPWVSAGREPQDPQRCERC